MSWKDEIRKKDALIGIKDRDGNKLTPREEMALRHKLSLSLSDGTSTGRYKEILDEANVDMREFIKILYKVRLPAKRMKERRKDSSEYAAV